jgi:hypothetical protein
MRKPGRLGLWDVGEADYVVLCDPCAARADEDGAMPGAEVIERGGWLLDETCDRCGRAHRTEEE